MKNLLYIIVLVLLVISCEDKTGSAAETQFLEQNKIGVYLDGNELVVYDENVHQLAYEPTAYKNLRLQNDDQSVYFSLSFSQRPSMGVGQTIEVEVLAKGVGVESGKYNVEVIKKNSDYVWLWDPTNKIGFIVK